MTASDTQGERTPSTLDVESTPEKAPRTSRTFRSMCSFAGGMTLGLLPLVLLLLNHLTISPPPPFLFKLGLTFCDPQTHLPAAKIAVLDTAAYMLYFLEAVLGVPAFILIGKAFHWRRSTIALCASGLLFAVVLEFFFWYAFLFPLSWHQCFHLVGER